MINIVNFFDSEPKEINRYNKIVDKINLLGKKVEGWTDAELKNKIQEYIDKTRAISDYQKQQDYLNQILPQVFAIVRESAKRSVGQYHRDPQLISAMVLHEGKIAEQKTGEGKTLTATLPLILNALTGKGCHLVTPNDYLSRHGAGWYGPVYDFLGLTVAVIIHDKSYVYDKDFENTEFDDEYARHLKPVERVQAYRSDITYGTNHEFGFDYLRDNMVYDIRHIVQTNQNSDWGSHYFCIVDEVDSILVDEARTPLIISASAEESTDKYYTFANLVTQLKAGTDYDVDEKDKAASLTEYGIRRLEKILNVSNLYEQDFDTIHHVEQSLKAISLYRKDRDYVVRGDEIVIVDEFTGRLKEGNRYSDGLHQAIEAKEGVTVKKESKTLATISYQNYFRMYSKLSGMTGTAKTEEEEFRKIYGLDVIRIPTWKPVVRMDKSDIVYKTVGAKWTAIALDIEEKHKKGQPVLVGTTSIENNELLHDVLKRKKVPHEILNAKQHEKEASIISQAGKKGAVTIATNMAGRGVDIILGGDPPNIEEQKEVIELGGLYVIGTERHESRRIDNQLRGRSGRQGDAGESRFYVSLQDDLMRIFGGDRVSGLMDRLGYDENLPLEAGLVSKAIENAQKKVEGHNFDMRKRVVEYDDIMNMQRDSIYRIRRRLIELGEDENITLSSLTPVEITQWLIDKLSNYQPNIQEIFIQHMEKIGEEAWFRIVKQVSLPVLDAIWMEHLTYMDYLRSGVGLRGYASRDPLVEYKNEGHIAFEKMVANVLSTIADRIVRVKVEEKSVQPLKEIDTSKFNYIRPELEIGVKAGGNVKANINRSVENNSGKIGRNEMCPCGSSKKWKKCGMINAPEHRK
ncbi:MAG: preprotein translocase subunit SecA [bacterium]|nr:preprotein translocase subunit SecA [bacterium]